MLKKINLVVVIYAEGNRFDIEDINYDVEVEEVTPRKVLSTNSLNSIADHIQVNDEVYEDIQAYFVEKSQEKLEKGEPEKVMKPNLIVRARPEPSLFCPIACQGCLFKLQCDREKRRSSDD